VHTEVVRRRAQAFDAEGRELAWGPSIYQGV